MHTWRERLWTSSLVRRSTVKWQLSHLYRAVLPGLCLPLANYLVSFFTPDLPWDTPLGFTHPSAQMDLKVKVSGRSKTHYGLAWPLDLWPTMSLSACVVSPLSPKWGEQGSLNPLCRYLDYCHDYYLKVFIRNKHWLFTLFLLLLPFQRANRRLIVNAWTGACLSLVSGNANSCRHPALSPHLCAPWNGNRRPIVNV